MSQSELLLGDWLETRLATAQPDLARRIRSTLPEHASTTSLDSGPELLGTVAAAALRRLLADGCAERASATPLLVVDALVTYACELLAEVPGDMGAGAEALLAQVASVSPSGDATA